MEPYDGSILELKNVVLPQDAKRWQNNTFLSIKHSFPKIHLFQDVLISCQRAVTALSVNPLLPHQIAIGCSDSTVRTFDRRTLGTIATGELISNYDIPFLIKIIEQVGRIMENQYDLYVVSRYLNSMENRIGSLPWATALMVKTYSSVIVVIIFIYLVSRYRIDDYKWKINDNTLKFQ